MNDKNIIKLNEVKDTIGKARTLLNDLVDNAGELNELEYDTLGQVWASLTRTRLLIALLTNKQDQ